MCGLCAAGVLASNGNLLSSYPQQAAAVLAYLQNQTHPRVPPKPDAVTWSFTEQAASHCKVKMQIYFYLIEKLVPATGVLHIKVWMRLSWRDERLVWDPTAFGGVTQVRMKPSDGLWVPDVWLYNGEVSDMGLTLEDAAASVSSDGSIFWSRPGQLKVICRFSGLVAFPRDTLSCPMEFSSWELSNLFMELQHMDDAIITYSDGRVEVQDGGYDLPRYETYKRQSTAPGAIALEHQSSSAAFRESYHEWLIKSINSTKRQDYYPCCPNEPWAIMAYQIELQRATSSYYMLNFEAPLIILTLISFLPFWIRVDSYPGSGRVSFGLTLILVTESSKSAYLSRLPVCGEVMWMMCFQLIHFSFAVASLVGSTVSTVLYNATAKEHISTSFDEFARRVLVVAYLFAICLLYFVRFNDGYESAAQGMFVGLGSLDFTHLGGASGNEAGYLILAICCSAAIAVVTSYGISKLTNLVFLRMMVAPRVERKLVALTHRRTERLAKYKQRADAFHQKRNTAAETSKRESSTVVPYDTAPVLPYDTATAMDAAIECRAAAVPPLVTDVA